ncbi:hypothetical protein FN846DRAFT_888107 [Sphaerosporella brunnea]|uniref:Uncharacterized protein n=1 Tax=Sphaerosporella brunnea TaxID=1250544 RepID=A0A5J5F442_9PEZI|nr:hypothetical protein FN846DRAFT_888107 [Sphaerosporella brunnea]
MSTSGKPVSQEHSGGLLHMLVEIPKVRNHPRFLALLEDLEAQTAATHQLVARSALVHQHLSSINAVFSRGPPPQAPLQLPRTLLTPIYSELRYLLALLELVRTLLRDVHRELALMHLDGTMRVWEDARTDYGVWRGLSVVESEREWVCRAERIREARFAVAAVDGWSEGVKEGLVEAGRSVMWALVLVREVERWVVVMEDGRWEWFGVEAARGGMALWEWEQKTKAGGGGGAGAEVLQP